MPTAARDAAPTYRRGSCARTARPASGAAAVPRVRGPQPSPASGQLSGTRVGPGVPAPRWRAASPQAPWSKTAAACRAGTVSAQTPRAAAGPRAAGTRRPAATARARRDSCPARLRPARPLPTAPGAAGQPGVPAATRVGPRGSRAGSGTGLGQASVPSPHPGSPASLDTVPLWHSVPRPQPPNQWLCAPRCPGPSFCPWSPLSFFSHFHAHPGLSQWVSPQGAEAGWRVPGRLSPSLPWPHPGPPRLAPGPRSVGRSSPRASPALSPHAHPCACMVAVPEAWGTAGGRASASSGKARLRDRVAVLSYRMAELP